MVPDDEPTLLPEQSPDPDGKRRVDEPAGRRRRGPIWRLARLLVITLVLLIAAVALAIVAIQTPYFKDWLRRYVTRQAVQVLNGELTIRRLGGNLFYGVELDDVAITHEGGRTIVIDRVKIDYSVFDLISRGIIIDELVLDRPIVLARQTAEGWNLTRLVKQRTEERPRGPGRPITISAIRITDGRLRVERSVAPAEPGVRRVATGQQASSVTTLEDLDLFMRLHYQTGELGVDVQHLNVQSTSPSWRIGRFVGNVARKEDALHLQGVRVQMPRSDLQVEGVVTGIGKEAQLDLAVTSAGLSFQEVGHFVPALSDLRVVPVLKARVRGPLREIQSDLQIRSQAGDAKGNVSLALQGEPRRIAGDLDLARVTIDPWIEPWVDQPNLDAFVTGRTKFDLALPDAKSGRPLSGKFHFVGSRARGYGYEAQNVDARGRFEGASVVIDAGRARAYGAVTTVAGRIEPVPGPAPGVQYRLKGRASGLDLRRLPKSLPVPDLATSLDADYEVDGRGRAFNGRARVRPSTIEGARLADGTQGYFSFAGRHMRYGGEGTVSGMDLPRLGRALRLKALTDRRLAGLLTGTFRLEASGRAARELVLNAEGVVSDTTLLGAVFPEMAYRASMQQGRLVANARGAFESLEPEFVTGNDRLAGVLNGTIDGEVTIADLTRDIALEDVGFTGRVELNDSSIGKVPLATARVAGSLASRVGKLDEFIAESPEIALEARGALALDKSSSSDLQYQVRRADLKAIGARFDQEVDGAATTEGRVTGNATELVATGTAEIQHARFRTALEAESAQIGYTVHLPELAMDRVRVDSSIQAGKLAVAGQPVDTFTGNITYVSKALQFDARAQDPTRTLEAGGQVQWLDGRQHIVLPKLAVLVSGVRWEVQPGTEAVIDLEPRQATITSLALANQHQRIHATGTFAIDPTAESNLQVRAEHVDLQQVEQVLGRQDRRFRGAFSADATITGTRAKPHAVATFSILNGAFRDVSYQRLGGRVDYGGRFVILDVTLEQQPGATLNTEGSVPLSLFSAQNGQGADDAIKLHITSTPVSLGLVQGLTPALTNVTGTAQADLSVGGTADNPLFAGTVIVSGGGFHVVPTGITYAGLTTALRFQPGRLRVDGLRVLDNNNDPLDLSGELGLRRTALGTLSITARAKEFGVLNNELGDVSVNADLRITGEVHRPRVQGEIQAHNARIEVDELLARLTGRAYATEAADEVPIPGVGQRPAEPPTAAPGEPPAGAAEKGKEPRGPGLVANSAIDVRVKLPDNAILRGRDLRTGPTSMGLGNINITVGGDFRVRKEPGTPVAVIGLVNTVRGSYDFRGRRFEILRDGRIQFQGAQPIDPALDVTAQRLIQPSGIEARIRIQGTARQPVLSFSSTPPLDESDILALIVFNRPLDQLGSGERATVAEVAGATAAGFVISPLTESLGRALNLDIFEVATTTEGGGTGGIVTVGQQVGKDLFFRFRQQFGGQEVSEFILEYQLSSFLRLQGSVAEGDGVGRANRSLTRRIERAGLDLIFYYSY
jgi:TamB, inner membrane protein subunit of TAM complex